MRNLTVLLAVLTIGCSSATRVRHYKDPRTVGTLGQHDSTVEVSVYGSPEECKRLPVAAHRQDELHQLSAGSLVEFYINPLAQVDAWRVLQRPGASFPPPPCAVEPPAAPIKLTPEEAWSLIQASDEPIVPDADPAAKGLIGNWLRAGWSVARPAINACLAGMRDSFRSPQTLHWNRAVGEVEVYDSAAACGAYWTLVEDIKGTPHRTPHPVEALGEILGCHGGEK